MEGGGFHCRCFGKEGGTGAGAIFQPSARREATRKWCVAGSCAVSCAVIKREDPTHVSWSTCHTISPVSTHCPHIICSYRYRYDT